MKNATIFKYLCHILTSNPQLYTLGGIVKSYNLILGVIFIFLFISHSLHCYPPCKEVFFPRIHASICYHFFLAGFRQNRKAHSNVLLLVLPKTQTTIFKTLNFVEQCVLIAFWKIDTEYSQWLFSALRFSLEMKNFLSTYFFITDHTQEDSSWERQERLLLLQELGMNRTLNLLRR